MEDEQYILAKSFIQNYIEKGRNKEQKQQYDLSQAIVYEHDQKYLQAGSLYYNLSIKESKYLENSIINTLISPASEKRQSLLLTLYKDHRTQKSQWYSFIQKNIQQEILQWNDIENFCKKTNFKQEIFCEHIIIGLSRIFSNISITKLKRYCKLNEEKVCELIENMIINERLNGQIDQVKGYVYFTHKAGSNIEYFCTNLYNILQ